jgi:hypothetical protein
MAADFECDRTYIQYTFRTYMQCIECTVQFIHSFAFIVHISYSCRKTGQLKLCLKCFNAMNTVDLPLAPMRVCVLPSILPVDCTFLLILEIFHIIYAVTV